LRELVGEFGVPVALDESLARIEPQELEEQRYARAVVLKPTLVGGILRTLRLAQSALRLGMMPVFSSAYESGVETAALVALAAGIGDRPVPAGLDTYRRMAGDLLETTLALLRAWAFGRLWKLAAGSTVESWRRSSFYGGSVRARGRWDILSGM
jgi:O-succinylbenzoate synthase